MDFFSWFVIKKKKKASPCDVFVFNLESKRSQTSAVVIAAAHNVMWCFTKASSGEYVVAGLTVSE